MANSRFISGTGCTPFEPDTPRPLLDGTIGDPVHTIQLPTAKSPELAKIPKKSLHPTEFKTVASYNWVYGPGKRLKVIVPGYPSCWNPPQLPARLPPDNGFRMIHQNEYFSPDTPLRPLLRAVYTHKPDYDIRGIDYVTDRNSVLKLFKFVRGESSTEPIKKPAVTGYTHPRGGLGSAERGGYHGRGRGGLPTPPASPGESWRDRHPASAGGGLATRGGYGRGRGGLGYRASSAMDPPNEVRIDVDIVGPTSGSTRASMLLSRWEPCSAEVVPQGKFMGWGYQFLSRFTRFGDAGEEAVMDDGELQSHHRVVEYRMGGKRFLVRFHGDAVTEGLAEFRVWAEGERGSRRRKERREKEKERERESEEREKEVSSGGKGKGGKKEGEGGESKAKKSPPPKKSDDWLEKEFLEGVAKLTLNRVKTTVAIEAHRSLAPLYPHASMVGIKTCTNNSAPNMMTRAIPQVFFSQTPHLFIGYHHRGVFERVEKVETGPLLEKWEDENEVVLKRYLVLLDKIRDVVEGMEGRRATLVFTTGKEDEGMKVYKRAKGAPGPVPSDLVAKWDV